MWPDRQMVDRQMDKKLTDKRTNEWAELHQFYCINISYPMDNCFTGRRDRSRQTTGKVILYIIPAGSVTFARCRLVSTSCLDRMTSSHLFRLAHGVYRRVFCCVVKREDF